MFSVGSNSEKRVAPTNGWAALNRELAFIWCATPHVQALLDTAALALHSPSRLPPAAAKLLHCPPHPPADGDKWMGGENNASAYVHHLSRDGEMCPFAAAHPAACRVWWVTTHQRRHISNLPGHTLVSHAILTDFNVGMRQWFEAGHCGVTHVVDVFNMTGAARNKALPAAWMSC